MGVGAIGGIVAYRRGQRVLAEARERGFVGNVQHAADTASAVANGTSRLLAIVGQTGQGSANPALPAFADVQEFEDKDARWRELQNSRIALGTTVRATRTTRKSRSQVAPSGAIRLRAHSSPDVVDVRPIRSNATG